MHFGAKSVGSVNSPKGNFSSFRISFLNTNCFLGYVENSNITQDLHAKNINSISWGKCVTKWEKAKRENSLHCLEKTKTTLDLYS